MADDLIFGDFVPDGGYDQFVSSGLQFINSMTEERLASLKNSDGKIPELANQLIITDDDDGSGSGSGGGSKVIWEVWE